MHRDRFGRTPTAGTHLGEPERRHQHEHQLRSTSSHRTTPAAFVLWTQALEREETKPDPSWDWPFELRPLYHTRTNMSTPKTWHTP
jgi:hypothetical protein